MCRNIRVLHHFEPPTTTDEIRAAAEQYVRKVSGVRAVTAADTVAFQRAVDAVTKATSRLLETLPERGAPRTREGERAKARTRWQSREARMAEKFAATKAVTGRTAPKVAPAGARPEATTAAGGRRRSSNAARATAAATRR